VAQRLSEITTIEAIGATATGAKMQRAGLDRLDACGENLGCRRSRQPAYLV